MSRELSLKLPEFSSVVAIREIEENDIVIPIGTRGCIVDVRPTHYNVEWMHPVHCVTTASEDDVEQDDPCPHEKRGIGAEAVMEDEDG
jgi:hypothetical protein